MLHRTASRFGISPRRADIPSLQFERAAHTPHTYSYISCKVQSAQHERASERANCTANVNANKQNLHTGTAFQMEFTVRTIPTQEYPVPICRVQDATPRYAARFNYLPCHPLNGVNAVSIKRMDLLDDPAVPETDRQTGRQTSRYILCVYAVYSVGYQREM